MMKIFLLLTIIIFIGFTPCAAQSGQGVLNGFVTSSIKNGAAINNATVVLTAIENNSNTKSIDTVLTKKGYYKLEVSFGYYKLTISAKGYKAYSTTVFIPSSSTLQLGTLLKKNRSTVPVDYYGKSTYSTSSGTGFVKCSACNGRGYKN